MAPNEAGFQLLLRYAAASNHKLSVKNTASAAGIAPSTASMRLSSAKKTKSNSKLSSTELTAALPVLIKYAEASGHNIVVKHFATAAGIAPSTASMRLTQARKDTASDATEPESGETGDVASKPIMKRHPKIAPNINKENGDVQADGEASVVTRKSKPNLKRKLNSSDDQDVEVDRDTTKHNKCNLAVVINNYDKTANSTDTEFDTKHGSENTNIDEGNEYTKSSHMPPEEHEPPKKKRGRPPKKTKDAISPFQANGKVDDGISITNNSSPISKDGNKAINDEHATAIDAAAISSERSLALDGTTDAHRLKDKNKACRFEAPLVDLGNHLQIDAHGTAGEMLDADHFGGAKTEETRSISIDPYGTNSAIGEFAVEEDVGMRSPEVTHDSLMDMYIDIEQGEAASKATAD